MIISTDYTRLVVKHLLKDPTMIRLAGILAISESGVLKMKGGFKENCWIYDVIREYDKACGVRAKMDGEYVNIRSKIVIDADGSNSIIAKKKGMFANTDTNDGINMQRLTSV